MPFVIGQFLGSALFGYFAAVSLVNAVLSVRNRRKALSDFGPENQRQGNVFLRLWIAVNLISFVLLTAAAFLVWSDWPAALVLGCAPVLLFAAANRISKPPAT